MEGGFPHNQGQPKQVSNLWKNKVVRHEIQNKYIPYEDRHPYRALINSLESIYSCTFSVDEIKSLQLSMLWLSERIAHGILETQSHEAANEKKLIESTKWCKLDEEMSESTFIKHDFAHGLFILRVKDRVTGEQDNSPKPAFINRTKNFSAALQASREELGPILISPFSLKEEVLLPYGLLPDGNPEKTVYGLQSLAQNIHNRGILIFKKLKTDHITREEVIEGTSFNDIEIDVSSEDAYIKTVSKVLNRVLVFGGTISIEGDSVDEIYKKYIEIKQLETEVMREVEDYLLTGDENKTYPTIEEATVPVAVDDLRRVYREHSKNPRIAFDINYPIIQSIAEKMKKKLSTRIVHRP